MRLRALVYAVVALGAGAYPASGRAAVTFTFGAVPPSAYGVPSPLAEGAAVSISCGATTDAGKTIDSLTIVISTGGATILTQALAITAGNTASGAMSWNVPAGAGVAYGFVCKAHDDGGMIGSRTSSSTTVTATSQAVPKPPVIDAFTGPTSAVLVGANASFAVTAHDPNTPPLALTYAWAASAGTVAGTDATATWTAPSTAGSYTVTVTVTNSSGYGATQSLAVQVSAAVYQGMLAATMGTPLRVAAAPGGELYVVNGKPYLYFLTKRGDLKGAIPLPDRGVAVAATATDVVVALANGKLLRFDPTTSRSLGEIASGSSTGAAGLAWDAANQRLWLAESDAGQLRAITLDGATVAIVTSAGATPLVAPCDVAVDAANGLVWTVMPTNQTGPLAHAFTLDGVYANRSVISFGTGPGQVERAGGVAVDAAGRVYVSDSLHGQVQVVTSSGASAGTLGSYGSAPGQLRQPSGMAFLANGDVAIASLDLARVDRFGNGAPLPTCAGDSDCDGIADADEVAAGLDPYNASDALLDSDRDGYSNAAEVALGSNPFDPASYPRPQLSAGALAAREPGLVRITSTPPAAYNGVPCTVAWQPAGGPASIALRDAGTATPSFVARAAGTYALSGLVTCGTVQSVPTLVQIVVNNVAPLADAGRIAVVRAGGKPLTLSGRYSSDANGDTVSFRWGQVAGAALTTKQAGAELTVRARTPGYYAFEVTASDPAGAARTAQVPVLVVDDQGGPTAIAATPLTGQAGQPVVLDASASVASADATFSWVQVAGPAAVLDSASSPTATFTPGAAGLYAFEANVIEASGMRSPPSRVEVYVAAGANGLPTARIAPVATAAVGAPVSLDGAASTAASGGALEYAWHQLAGPAAGLNDADRAVAEVVAFDPGSYVFELTVKENGVPGVPVTVRLDALRDGTALPVAWATGPATMFAGDVAVLDGRASVGGKTFRWTQVAGPWTALWNADGATAVFRPVVPGQYAFDLEAFDGTARSAPARVDVRVEPSKESP